MTFAAIDPVLEVIVESPKEGRGGASFVRWGERNTYPQFIETLAKGCPTLRSVILGAVDYICGDDIQVAPEYERKFRGGIRKFVKAAGYSVMLSGGFAFEQIWDVAHNDYTLGVLPVKFLRTDEDNASFWYSEKWGRGGAMNAVEIPGWVKDTQLPHCIYFCKVWGDGVYPEPIFAASVKDATTEMAISDYHLGNIERGFMGSYLVNFNNGNVPDALKKEIEKSFTEKFAGHKNAGRIMFSFNPNVQNRTTLEKMEVSDFGEKYDTLAKHCRQQIFTAFRAHPTLFGLAESSGFNREEFDGAFRLFNRTMIQPVQQQIIDGIEEVCGQRGIVKITPFTLDGKKEEVA